MRKYTIHTKEQYVTALKLNKEGGLGPERISSIIDVPVSTIGHWLYKGRKPMKRVRLKRDDLFNLYWEKKLSLRQIASKLKVDNKTIFRWMKKLNIPRRSRSEACKLHPPNLIEPDLIKKEVLSYIMGVILGDGYCSSKPRNDGRGGERGFVNLAVTSKKFALSFKRSLEEIGLHPFFYSRKKKQHIKFPGGRISKKRKKQFVVWAWSNRFYEWFKNNKDLEWVKEKKEYMKGFIRGFYESEGSDREYNSIRIYNSNEWLIDFVWKLLKKLGFDFKKYKRIRNGSLKFVLVLFKNDEILRFIQEIDPCIKCDPRCLK